MSRLHPQEYKRVSIHAVRLIRQEAVRYRQKNLTAPMITIHKTADMKKAEIKPTNFVM